MGIAHGGTVLHNLATQRDFPTGIAVAGNVVWRGLPTRWRLLTHTEWGSNSPSVSTTAIDTTRADLIVVAVAFWQNIAGSLTDSKGNTWILFRRHAPAGGTNAGLQVWFLRPTSDSQVGPDHIFTASIGNGLGCCAMAFRGSAEAPADQQSSASGPSTTTTNSGSITPTEPESLVLALGSSAAAGQIGSVTPVLFRLIARTISGMGLGAAFFVQREPAPIEATWTAPNSWGLTSMILSFKPAEN